MLVTGFHITTSPLVRCHYHLFVDVCDSKACAPEHREKWTRSCSPCKLPEPGLGPGSLGTFDCWWQSFSKGIRTCTSKVVNLCSPLCLPHCSREPGLGLLPLLRGRFITEWEAEVVWSQCFLCSSRKCIYWWFEKNSFESFKTAYWHIIYVKMSNSYAVYKFL